MAFDITSAKDNSDLPDNLVLEIAELYEKVIIVPDVKPKRQILLCPVGLIGAGKTTVVKLLSDKLNLVRISNDEIRQILKEKGYNYNRVGEISFLVMEKFLRDGYSAAIDGNSASNKAKKFVADAIEMHKLVAIWILIDPPEQFIINKLKNFPHTWLFQNAEEAVKGYFEYKKHYKYDHDDLNFIYTFDPSKTNLDDQIEEAEKLIKYKLNS